MNASTYIHVHVGVGWTGVAFGALAMALRLPDFFCLMGGCIIPDSNKIISRATVRILHGISGGVYLVCCLFMPLTANWIWPRYGTPMEIIYLIVSMYMAIVAGIVCIRVYKLLSPSVHNKAPQQQEQITNEESVIVAQNLDEAAQSEVVEDAPSDQQKRSRCPSLNEIRCNRRVWLLFLLKYSHALIMVYSWVMLLGAGQAFLLNSRANGFPYPAGPITDSLVARCYARDLQSSAPEMPSWLLNLTCGLGVMCADSSS
jgi:hypothetical protein